MRGVHPISTAWSTIGNWTVCASPIFQVFTTWTANFWPTFGTGLVFNVQYATDTHNAIITGPANQNTWLAGFFLNTNNPLTLLNGLMSGNLSQTQGQFGEFDILFQFNLPPAGTAVPLGLKVDWTSTIEQSTGLKSSINYNDPMMFTLFDPDGNVVPNLLFESSTGDFLGVTNGASLLAQTETPLPATLPLFATGLGALGVLGWRRKKKAAKLAA